MVEALPASSRRQRFVALRSAAPVILPSLLLCDFAHLADEIHRLEDAGVRALHLDVMDGNFVPNLSYGLPIVEAVRRVTDLPIDVHLMIADPGRYLEQFVAAGADSITFHVEAVANPRPLIDKLHGMDVAAGLAYNPATPIESVLPFLDACDLVLTMSVAAGFGGQPFVPVALDRLRQLAPGRDRVLLEVDGGVNARTIGACAQAGAQLFVVGSAIFGQEEDYTQSVATLTRLAQTHARTH